MKLYHGTTLTAAQAALNEGLKPRHFKKGNWNGPGQVRSIPKMIYFSNNFDMGCFYGMRACICQQDYHYSILECEVDEDKLYPDENMFAVANENGHIFAKEMKEAQKQVLKNKDKWRESLEKRKTVCHYGTVPAQQLKIIESSPREKNQWFFLGNQTYTETEFDNKFYYWIYGEGTYITAANVNYITIKWESPLVKVYEKDKLLYQGKELP